MDQYAASEVSFNQTCSSCNRSFARLAAFTHHSASCVPKKRRLANALATAQVLFREKKRRRLEGLVGQKEVIAIPEDSSTSSLKTGSTSTMTLANEHVCTSVCCFDYWLNNLGFGYYGNIRNIDKAQQHNGH